MGIPKRNATTTFIAALYRPDCRFRKHHHHRQMRVPSVRILPLVWALFSAMLFILEPWFLHAWFRRKAEAAPIAAMALIQRLHMVLITLSLIVIFGAVMGAHS
jgi:hypothetical protein